MVFIFHTLSGSQENKRMHIKCAYALNFTLNAHTHTTHIIKPNDEESNTSRLTDFIINYIHIYKHTR